MYQPRRSFHRDLPAIAGERAQQDTAVAIGFCKRYGDSIWANPDATRHDLLKREPQDRGSQPSNCGGRELEPGIDRHCCFSSTSANTCTNCDRAHGVRSDRLIGNSCDICDNRITDRPFRLGRENLAVDVEDTKSSRFSYNHACLER